MRALKLDYRVDNRYQTVAAIIVLFMLLGLMAGEVWFFSKVNQQKSQLEAILANIKSGLHGGDVASQQGQLDPAKMTEAFKYSDHVIRQLNLPWGRLFLKLEKARGDHVALLAIEPDANSNKIRVVGEAKDYLAMIDYVRGLSQGGELQSVYLLEHKMDEQNPDQPIRFSLEASWAAKLP